MSRIENYFISKLRNLELNCRILESRLRIQYKRDHFFQLSIEFDKLSCSYYDKIQEKLQNLKIKWVFLGKTRYLTSKTQSKLENLLKNAWNGEDLR